MAAGHQRHRCKTCGRSFTATPPRGKPPAMKALAVLLYGLGNVSQGMIAKLLGVSHVSGGDDRQASGGEPRRGLQVGSCCRRGGTRTFDLTPRQHRADRRDVALRGRKKTRFGSGEPLILWHGEPWPGSWVGVMTRPVGDFSTGSASTATSS